MLALLLVPAGAQAHSADAFGFGSRAAAMAGAATAISDDVSANYYNPGGLAVRRDLEIDVGYAYAQPRLRLNGRDTGSDSSRGWLFGLVIPGRIGWLRFAFGGAVMLPDQRLLRIRALAYEQPQFVYYDNRPQRLYFSANVALALPGGLYLGGGLSFLSGASGNLAVEGTLLPFSANDSALVSRIQVDLPAVSYPEFGLRWQPHPSLVLGVSYRHSFVFKIDQAFRIRANIGDPPVVENASIVARAVIADLFQPWQITFGAAARLTPRLLVAADWTYARWSEFPVPVAAFTADVELGMFSAFLRLPPPRSYPPAGFHDLFIPRMGAEWRAWQNAAVGVDLRGGYAFEASPAPEQVGESNLVDNDKHTFSTGAGVEVKALGGILSRPLGIDVHLALTYLPGRAHRKLDPLDPVGDYVSGGVVVQLGCMLRSRF